MWLTSHVSHVTCGIALEHTCAAYMRRSLHVQHMGRACRAYVCAHTYALYAIYIWGMQSISCSRTCIAYRAYIRVTRHLKTAYASSVRQQYTHTSHELKASYASSSGQHIHTSHALLGKCSSTRQRGSCSCSRSLGSSPPPLRILSLSILSF